MHPVEKREIWALGGILLLLLPFYFWLATAGVGVYASPDETANAITIRQLDWYGRITVAEPLAKDFPWVHPRSYISQGDAIAPVGFLGWPWIISVFSLILGQGMVPILATLAAVSMAIPLFGLLRRFGRAPAFAGVIIGMTFPTLILFGNRALFPQIGLLVLGVWTMFGLSRLSSKDAPWKFGALAFLGTLAMSARPTEIIWLLPWFAWFAKDLRPDRKRIIAACVGALIPLMFIGFHAQISYGGFWKSGYMARDNGSVEMIALPAGPNDPTRSIVFPFGIHPKYLVWNVWSFLFKLLFPWTVLVIAAAVSIGWEMKQSKERNWKKFIERHAVTLLSLWTVGFLIAYYGQGLYTDHVQRGAVTIANSFVRYLLPLAPLAALATAYLFQKYQDRPRGALVLIGLVMVLSGYGTWVALARDNEGLIATRGELVRYLDIRRQAAEHFGPTDLILSERSDKIFFPGHRTALIPANLEVARLVKAHPEVRVGLFARPLSQSQADAWRKAGFEPNELLVSGREKLYLLSPIRR
ncbi:glycosyltransferase family 39 protein [Patescibacteria group bacterium]|jgi:hypothetical protein|nr:glycosyltransferase family 39 protein [Patescibacteria group bacterium]